MSRPIAVSALFFLLMLSNPIEILAQLSGHNPATLTGTVYTAKGDQPVLHANVRLCDPGGTLLSESITGDSGDFAFRGIQHGKYILQVSAVGFEDTSVSVDLSFMSDRGIPIYLKPKPIGTKEPERSGSITAHEMSMPQAARDLLAEGKKKLYTDKNAEGALQEFQSALAAAPGYYEAYYQIGMAQLTQGKREDAEASFRKCIELSGDKYGEADVGVGTMLLDRKDFAQGEKMIRRGIELSPDYWMGHYELGRALLNQDRIPDALQSAQQAKSLAPGAAIVYRLLSNIHLQQKDYPALLADIDAYIKLDPDSAAGIRAKELRDQVTQKVETAKATSTAQKTP
jgi:Carboxypeptidase regulatory-like domain/Tetratricopeptide repeat